MDATFTSGALSSAERRRLLAFRSWRAAERRVVVRGVAGRAVTALEPAAIGCLLLWVAIVLALRVTVDQGRPIHPDLPVAVIFAPVALGFFIYAGWLISEPLRALRQTYEPIFILDGYVRTRGRDDFSERGSCGYVAAITPDLRVAGEWPARGPEEYRHVQRPALLEFTEYGGLHAIDGRATGILPADFPAFGVGGNRPPR
ncbi:MAG TPA: hypothetical protein VJN22_07490 [Candidatus Eremiobacteraceae bacterium]|nr:hypothetical protein [Candidatus Eremiobacteraceae bacterium]